MGWGEHKAVLEWGCKGEVQTDRQSEKEDRMREKQTEEGSVEKERETGESKWISIF